MSKELNKAPVEQAGGDERVKCAVCVDSGKVYDISGEGPWKCYACTGSHKVIGYANGDELDNMLDDRTAVLSPVKTSFHTVPVYREARAALAQPSPASELERPEVAEVAFVLRNIGAMDAEDIDGDNVDLRFEDAEGRDTGCDVSIVEYAEKAADLFEQHDRIVGALRAEITQLRQHKNDYMDAGQETYRALQNEIREREAEIARLDGLVSGRTAERDAALAEIAELEKKLAMTSDAASKGDAARHAAGGMEMEIQELKAKLADAQAGRQAGRREQSAYELLRQALKLMPLGTKKRAEWVGRTSDLLCIAQAQHSVPEISGIGRDAEHPRAVVLYLRNEPSDEDMRAIQNFLRAMAAPAQHSVPKAWLDVQAERRRQVEAEGWTPEHDDLYCAAELPRAAAAYILNGANDEAPAIWPFSAKWWKPSTARRDMVKACALALAEIERLRESKGDPVGSLEKCMKVMYERDEHAKRLEVALARVAELERQEPVAYRIEARDERGIVRRDCLSRTPFNEGLPDAKQWAGNFTVTSTPLYAAPVAQTQHSVPVAREQLERLVRILDAHNYAKDAEALMALLAAAPGNSAQHSVPDGAADLCRFLAKLYCELDGLRYSTAKLPAEQIADALIFKWPVLQGARNQLNIKRISEQPYDESKLHSAIAAMLAAAPGKEGV